MKRKKTLAVVLAVLLVGTSGCIWMYSSANEKTVEPNVLLLESLLENRYWVVESLVFDNTKNNPYTELIDYATEESFMEEVISNYSNDTAFRVLVDCLEMGDNAGTYVQNLGQESIAVLLNVFGVIDDEGLIDYVDNHVKSVEDLQYEAIINAVLSTDYTSSWGSTLFEADAELERYRQSAKLLSGLGDFQKACLANSELLSAGYFESAEDFTDYVDNFLPAFEDNLYNMLISVPGCEQFSDNEALTKKIIGSAALAFSIDAMAYNPLKSLEEGTQEHSEWLMSDDYSTYFAPTIDGLLKVYGKTLELRSLAVEYAVLFETLMAQKETTIDVLKRIRQTTDDIDLANTINVYEDMVNDQGNDQALAYDAIINHLEKQNTVGTAVIKGGHKLFDRYLTKRNGYYDVSNGVMTNGISQNLIKLGKCISLGVWVADKATNIKETVKKIHLCKYINKIIDSATDIFVDDLVAYSNDKTDENAKKCLDDLEFIKKLRLYGETQAYGSVCSQTESVIGLLLGGNDVQDYIDERYNANIDALLGCTVYPTSNFEFSVNEGQTLELWTRSLSNGKNTIYAVLRDENNKSIMQFPEADVILMGSLKLNGGTIKLMSDMTIDSNIQLFIPTLTVSQESDIEVKGAKGARVAFGNITNNSTLNITIDNAESTFDVVEQLNNTGTINCSSTGSKWNLFDINNTGTISLESTIANVYGNITNNGTINGEVIICGDGTKTYEDGYYEKTIQTLSGNGTYSKLIFDSRQKEGIKITGQQSVTEYLANRSTRLRTSENIYVSENCAIENNEFDGNISFRDYTTSSDFIVGGMAYIHNNVAFSGKATFEDGLNITSNCQTLTLNGETVVKGDMQYSAGTIAGSDWLKLYGDLTVSASSPSISNLDFVGLTGQTITLSSPLTVGKLNNQNLSLSGVDVTSKIYVTEQLTSSSTSKYENGKNIVLTGTAILNGDKVQGSISAENWTCSNSATIKGTLFASGDIALADNVELTLSGYQQSSGILAIPQSSKINTKGDMILSCATTNNGEITVEGDYKTTGAVSGGNGVLNVVGDCYIQNTYSSGTLSVKGDTEANSAITLNTLIFDAKLAQKFNNTSTTNVENLEINNTSISGFTVGSVINVNNHFINNAKKLINPENIILSNGASYDDTGFAKTDFTISGNYTVPAGETMIVSGNLTILSGAVLTVEEGAKIEVGRSVVSNGATIIVNEGAKFEIADYLNSTSDTYQVDGDLVVTGDAKLSSATVNAKGLMTFKGDLTVSSGTWNNPNIAFISKVPQTISGSTINVNNITIDNTSKSGITINLTYNVSGDENIISTSSNSEAQTED